MSSQEKRNAFQRNKNLSGGASSEEVPIEEINE